MDLDELCCMQLDNLEAKRSVNQETEESRPLALHVFGIDSMSTKDIMSYFGDYGPSWVEWINDSSCNVVFEDTASVTRVLVVAAIPPDGDESQIEKDQLIWREAVPFVRFNGEQVPLHMRQATMADIRPERPNPNSSWARSLQRKHKQRQKQGGGKAAKKRRHREDRDMDMDEGGDDDFDGSTRSKKHRTEDGADGEDGPRRMKLNSDDAQRMASMLGKDLRAIISQRKQDEDVVASDNVEMADDTAEPEAGEEVISQECAEVPASDPAEEVAEDPDL